LETVQGTAYDSNDKSSDKMDSSSENDELKEGRFLHNTKKNVQISLN